MEQNPDGAKELRRQNRSYVFFREVQLSDKDEAVGAQGVPLTPGRSIAVDKALHVYGTPFFIEGELPIESEQAKTPFRRLMIAQDTGSAIVGPARADLYFGAGAEAGKVSGRLRHNARFVMLVPNSLDPVARGRNHAAAGNAAVGEDREAVSAESTAERSPGRRSSKGRAPAGAAVHRPRRRLRHRRRLPPVTAARHRADHRRRSIAARRCHRCAHDETPRSMPEMPRRHAASAA